MEEGERVELSRDWPAGFRDRCNTIMRTLRDLFEAGAGGVEPPSVVLETNMLPVTPCSLDARLPSVAKAVLDLVLREGIEPTWPPGPAVLQAAAIPFCHLSTIEIRAIFNCQKTKKERIRSELKA